MKINGQITLDQMDADYAEFVKKFKPKKTTDDCYTPENVYNAVLSWAASEYGFSPEAVIRPFWPGADYTAIDYPDGCIVLDNPPFSIITPIVRTYVTAGIRFFLFAPYLTNFSTEAGGVCHIITDVKITYDNGAKVNTAFITNLEPEYKIRTAPALNQMLLTADYDNTHKDVKPIPKYVYPDNTITATQVGRLSRKGVEFRVRADQCLWVDALEEQRKAGKKFFGGGFLVTDDVAQAAKEAEAQIVFKERQEGQIIEWTLSEREREAIRRLEAGAQKRQGTDGICL